MRSLLVLAIVASGCRTHVALNPLPPNLLPEERVATYERMKALSDSVAEYCNGPGVGGGYCKSAPAATLTLSDRAVNGGVVEYAEDVLPLVGADSETASHARNARHSDRWWQRWAGASLVTLGAGFGIWFDNYSDTIASSPRRELVEGLLFVGVIAGAIAYGYRHNENTESRQAFAAYNHDLRTQLRVCAVDLYHVAPCESLPPKAVPSAPAAP